MTIYRRISVSDPEYELEKQLRNRVLRLPLGLVLSEQDVHGEDEQVHLVALDDAEQVIGCALVFFFENSARIRQMAIEESCRGQGIGTELVKRAEQAILVRNIRTVGVHARISARGFYEKLGYTAVSETFFEVSVPHVSMEKNVAAS